MWVTPDTIRDKHESEEEWKQLYAAVHPASPSPSLTPIFTLALALALPPNPSPNLSPNPNPNPNQVHPASRNDMVELVFTEPVKLRPGQGCGFYVHSALPGDEAIVYDNQRSSVTYQDRCFKVMPGLAHLSNKPFGKRGFWGRPWRTNREFVGRVNYGALLMSNTRWLRLQPAGSP